MDTLGKDSLVEQWTSRYPWAYIDAAKTQLGLLLRDISAGHIRPSLGDVTHLNAALDDLALQTVVLRQMLTEVTARHGPTGGETPAWQVGWLRERPEG